MSLSRGLTTRSKQQDHSQQSTTMPFPNLLKKSSTKTPERKISIAHISSPTLLSTTNVQTLNHPSIKAARQIRKVPSLASTSSAHTDLDSDGSSVSPRSRGTSFTDHSSVGSTPSSPKPGEARFASYSSTKSSPPPPRRAASSSNIKQRALSFEPSPSVPSRAPAHSKIAHEQLARKRSLQTMNTWQDPARSVPAVPAIPSTHIEKRTSRDLFNSWFDSPPMPSSTNSLKTSSVQSSHSGSHTSHSGSHSSRSTTTSTFSTGSQHSQTTHPFGKELMQLDEIAEEFGGAVRDAERQADARAMAQKGLVKVSANDYIRDIEPLFERLFVWRTSRAPPMSQSMGAGWI
ncbi:hypothetical protein BT63DRAFT_449478 [Microthyrium microscopicum]|uniref:Uncharacterized protein n=1 Tax=Microthyrium microscopicum TaxID=703497 RepID=A0A6A6UST4_9PEZI|nr:hypothetical protein BT63DRAFT_449478 [Microthyrium microscopicum]